MGTNVKSLGEIFTSGFLGVSLIERGGLSAAITNYRVKSQKSIIHMDKQKVLN